MKFRKYLPRKTKLVINEIHYKIYGRKMPWSQLKFEIHLVDRCNLNCAGCLHFSQLCKDTNILGLDDYENDCRRISILTDGKIANILLLGGEPLLHPNVIDLIIITRKYFPNKNESNNTGIIELVTNGILLPEQNDEFWKKCRDNHIKIVISTYPIKIKLETIKEKANKFNVELKINSDEIQDKMTGLASQWAKIPMDINGLQDHKNSFSKCFLSGNCFQLVRGKIFKCARIAYINYFNKTYNLNMEISENDYIDIYKANNISEILYKLSTPASFCRYCKVDKITWDNKWKKSKMELNEYL
jgi:organic radical activating enzyme